MMHGAVMVDLETLASVSNAAIIQLAAVAFDINTGDIHTSFNAYVKSGSGYISRDTALWWMGQPHAATIAARVNREGEPLRQVLTSFVGWLAPYKGRPLFAHGAPFDFPVLRAAFEACEMAPPWSYREELCTRSYYRELREGKPPEVARDPGAPEHCALADCRHQIKQLVAARRELGLVQEAA